MAHRNQLHALDRQGVGNFNGAGNLACTTATTQWWLFLWYTESMNGWYFYTGVLGFVFGVGVASVYTIGFADVTWMVILAGGVWVLARRRGEALPSRKLFLIPLLLLAIALGVIRFNLATFDEINPIYEVQIGTPISLEGVVVREPDVRENTTHLYVRVGNELFLVKTNRYANVQYGDRIAIQGMLRKPEVFETDLGRTFNYPMYLRSKGVSYTISFAQIDVLEHNQGNAFIAKLLQGKQQFMQQLESILPEPQVGLAEGLLLGVKQALGDELEEVFRATGIIHIVVLSGYNIMIVVLFIMYVLAYVVPYRARPWFGLLGIVSFALLVGLSSTVVRASIMASLVLLARWLGRAYAVTRALMLAGVVMILLNPYVLVYDIGFQLSFLATLGLILGASFIEKKVWFMPETFGLREFLTATIVTQIVVMPILLYNIGQFSLVSVIVNVLVLPLVPVAMLATFLTGMLSFVSASLASIAGFFTYLVLSYILEIATFFAQVPYASFTVNSFPFWIVVAGYIFLGWFTYTYMYINNEEGGDVLDSDEDANHNKIEDGDIARWTIEEEEVVRRRLEQQKMRP